MFKVKSKLFTFVFAAGMVSGQVYAMDSVLEAAASAIVASDGIRRQAMQGARTVRRAAVQGAQVAVNGLLDSGVSAVGAIEGVKRVVEATRSMATRQNLVNGAEFAVNRLLDSGVSAVGTMDDVKRAVEVTRSMATRQNLVSVAQGIAPTAIVAGFAYLAMKLSSYADRPEQITMTDSERNAFQIRESFNRWMRDNLKANEQRRAKLYADLNEANDRAMKEEEDREELAAMARIAAAIQQERKELSDAVVQNNAEVFQKKEQEIQALQLLQEKISKRIVNKAILRYVAKKRDVKAQLAAQEAAAAQLVQQQAEAARQAAQKQEEDAKFAKYKADAEEEARLVEKYKAAEAKRAEIARQAKMQEKYRLEQAALEQKRHNEMMSQNKAQQDRMQRMLDQWRTDTNSF